MQNAGISPSGVIASATSNPAKVLGHADELGTVEPGKLADLLVLEADPLVDVGNIKRIRYVIKDGCVYEPRRLLAKVLEMDGRSDP
jgi:imidazolonepropionase-like amidohydrolase